MTFGFPTNFRFGSRIGFPQGSASAPVTPISLVASAKQGGNADSNTTAAIDTTGATLLVAYVPYYNIGSPTVGVSDSKGNTWAALTTQTVGTITGTMYYVKNPVVGSGHTFTQTNSAPGVYSGIVVAAFDSTDTAANVDGQAGSTVVASGALTIQPGSLTPSEGNCLMVAAIGYFDQPAARTSSIDSSFTEIQELTDATTVCVSMAYKVQTTASAENPTFTAPINQFGLVSTISAYQHS